MKKSLRDQWCKELRDPERKQAQGRLHLPDGSMCCLGVLMDIALEWPWEPVMDAGGNLFCYAKGGEAHHLGYENDHLGLPIDDEDTLMGMNDDGKTFPEIADWIEKNVEVD